MFNLTGEQVIMIFTSLLSLLSAVWVAMINREPKNKSIEIEASRARAEAEKLNRERTSFFYTEYHNLYEKKKEEVKVLRKENIVLKEKISQLEERVNSLENVVKGYEFEVNTERNEVSKKVETKTRI